MLEKVKGGYKVKREHGEGYFSRKPQTKAKASAQLRAIEANKHRHAYDCSDEGDMEPERTEYCSCQDIPEEALRKPYRLHRTAGGRIRIEYASMDSDDQDVTTVADARKHLQRHAQCACDEG